MSCHQREERKYGWDIRGCQGEDGFELSLGDWWNLVRLRGVVEPEDGEGQAWKGSEQRFGVHLNDSLESPSFLGEERPGGKECVEEQMDLISRWE